VPWRDTRKGKPPQRNSAREAPNREALAAVLVSRGWMLPIDSNVGYILGFQTTEPLFSFLTERERPGQSEVSEVKRDQRVWVVGDNFGVALTKTEVVGVLNCLAFAVEQVSEGEFQTRFGAELAAIEDLRQRLDRCYLSVVASVDSFSAEVERFLFSARVRVPSKQRAERRGWIRVGDIRIRPSYSDHYSDELV